MSLHALFVGLCIGVYSCAILYPIMTNMIMAMALFSTEHGKICLKCKDVVNANNLHIQRGLRFMDLMNTFSNYNHKTKMYIVKQKHLNQG